jgi:hypothetical protein
MELSLSWESDSLSVAQEFSNILWNPKVHYRVHKSHPLYPILNETNPVHTIPSYLSKFYVYTINHLRLGLPCGLFPSTFPIKILYVFVFGLHACYIPYPFHSPWLDHSNYIWRRVQVVKLLSMQFSPTYRHFISLLVNIFQNGLLLYVFIYLFYL